MEENVRAHAIISGRVQGVFFRMETFKTAQRYGVCGWVKNLYNGDVEAVFEGEKEQVDAVLKWCHQGPRHARVTNVEVDWLPYSGDYADFKIMY